MIKLNFTNNILTSHASVDDAISDGVYLSDENFETLLDKQRTEGVPIVLDTATNTAIIPTVKWSISCTGWDGVSEWICDFAVARSSRLSLMKSTYASALSSHTITSSIINAVIDCRPEDVSRVTALITNMEANFETSIDYKCYDNVTYIPATLAQVKQILAEITTEVRRLWTVQDGYERLIRAAMTLAELDAIKIIF